MHLPQVPALVAGGEQAYGVLRRGTGRQQSQTARAVVGVEQGLGGNGAYPGLDEGVARAHGKELARDGNADAARRLVAGDDGEGHRWPPVVLQSTGNIGPCGAVRQDVSGRRGWRSSASETNWSWQRGMLTCPHDEADGKQLSKRYAPGQRNGRTMRPSCFWHWIASVPVPITPRWRSSQPLTRRLRKLNAASKPRMQRLRLRSRASAREGYL